MPKVVGNWGDLLAGMTAASALLLVYCALLVPVQLSFWRTDDSCTLYPTVMPPQRSADRTSTLIRAHFAPPIAPFRAPACCHQRPALRQRCMRAGRRYSTATAMLPATALPLTATVPAASSPRTVRAGPLMPPRHGCRTGRARTGHTVPELAQPIQAVPCAAAACPHPISCDPAAQHPQPPACSADPGTVTRRQW